jgi:hypothetical protein
LAAFFFVPLVSLALLVLYSKTLYGSYSPADIFPKESYWSVPWLLRLKVFLSYFLDQRDGLLFYGPIFFLAFAGFKKRFEGRGLLLVMGFVYVFFHAFTTVRGAYSPAGRPLMFIAWILILSLANIYFNKIKDKDGGGQGFTFRLLTGLSVFVLAWLLYYPLFVYQPVFSHTVQRASGLNLFLGGDFMPLWNLFPSFITSPISSHPANYVWVKTLVILAVLYYLLKPFSLRRSAAPAAAGLFLVFAYLYCFYPHVHLINKNKHTDKVISFYNNSKNFRYIAERNGFRIKAGNRYDIFIDRKMIHRETVTFHFTLTDVSGLTLRNGRRVLFESKGAPQETITLNLTSLTPLTVKNKQVSHIGFETRAEDKNAFLWLEIR